jgi:hypothetical protein
MAEGLHHTDERTADPLHDVGESGPPGAVAMSPPTPAPPAGGTRVLVPRWVQLVLLPLAILGAYGLLRAAGPIALLFIIAGLIALLLNPFVSLLRRARFPRGFAVLTVLMSLVLLLAGAATLLANRIADQVTALQNNIPELVRNANRELADLQGWLDRKGIGIQVKEPGETRSPPSGSSSRRAGELVDFTREALTLLVEGLDRAHPDHRPGHLHAALRRAHRRDRAPRRAVGRRRRRTTSPPASRAPSSLRPRPALFSLIMGVSAGVMLYVLGSVGIFEEGRTYALFFGIFFGFAELIPYVGPAIGAAPPMLIAAFGASRSTPSGSASPSRRSSRSRATSSPRRCSATT